MQFKRLAETGSGKNFIRLKDGESVVGVFRSDPHDFRVHWDHGQSIECVGAGCPQCKAGSKSAFRFRINFITQENGAYVAKIFEQGKAVYMALGALHSSGYDLTKTVVSITRTGSGKNDTQYNVLPLPPPKGIVTDAFEAKLQAIKLHDLAGSHDDSAEANAPADGDDIPF